MTPIAAPAFETAQLSAVDGYPLRYRRYPATDDAGMAIACIHGIQSHAGWYERSCSAYAASGFPTYFFDRRGSGANAEARGRTRGWRQLVDDLRRCIGAVRIENPGRKLALVAISWGAKIAVAAMKEHPDLVDAAVFVCPGWFPVVGPPLRQKLAIGWSALLWPHRQLPIPLNDPGLFTANPDRQDYIRNDPLSLRLASARLLFSSRLLDRAIASAPERVATPSLLLLAKHERIIDNASTRSYFARFASVEKKVVEFDAHHTLEFEPDPEPPIAATIDWLKSQAADGAAR